MGTFKLHISCTQAMCSLQYRHVQAIYGPFFVYIIGGPLAAPLYISLAWSIYGLYCRLRMACVQLTCSLNVPTRGLDM